MSLRYDISVAANLEGFLTNFMNQNQISAYDMRNFLNNFIISLNNIIQTELLIEIQEEEQKQQQEKEMQQDAPIEEN